MIKIILIYLKIIFVFANVDFEIELINNITATFENKNFFIILGYDKKDTVQMMSNLFGNGYQSSFYYNLNEILFLELENTAVFIINLNSDITDELVETANFTNLFNFPNKWIMINNDNITDLENTVQKFSKYNFLVDSDIFLANKINISTYLIQQVYKINKNDKFVIIEEFGYFSENLGLRIKEKDSVIAVRRKNLRRTVLRTSIVITHNDSLNHLTDYRDKHIDSITKVNYILVQHLADTVNASLSYTIKDTWGYETNMSTWTGMLGDLTEDKADIGGTALFVTSDRVAVIDYIAMTTATRSYFIFRQPKLSYVTNVFTLPFDRTVWISSFVLVFITTTGLFITFKWEKITKKSDPTWDLEGKDAIVLSVGAVCQQGASQVPELTSGRILTLFIFVSLMFLFTSYSANIVALLQSSSNSIKTLDDLLKSRLELGVDDTVFNRFYFPTATEPVRKAIYEEKIAPKNQDPKFLPIEEGIKKLRRGLFAFHVEGGSGYKLISETFYEDQKCDLEEISYLQVPDPWLAIQKNLAYKEMLKLGLRQIQESGLQEREVSRIYTKKPKCHGSGSSFVSVSLIDVYFAIVIYVTGLLISVVVCVIEILVYKRIVLRM